ncbi:MAG: TatD family hydrolase [Lachnospiraceae bacterium]|nr:TatD family hydrolase [Lachnospiraceae bacterium]
MIFDTHAHYDDEAFEEDRDRLLGEELKAAGIVKVMNVAADTTSLDTTNELSLRFENVYAALGIHPSETEDLSESDMDHIRKLVLENEKVRAIGEIGFDYHYDSPGRDCQKKWFVRQIELAGELDLPVIIHSRDAAEDTLNIIKEYYPVTKDKINGVIHCYSYAAQDAREYVKRGFLIGVGGVITFKNARKLKETVESIELENIVLETDCPYLAPVPYRGERNCSLYLPYVVSCIAEIKAVERDVVENITFENAMRLYRLI